MEDAVSDTTKAIQQLNDDLLQFITVFTPTVQDICSRNNITQSELEHFLDYLVPACINDEMLFWFKKVCRRFYKEYPEMIAEYIMFYKELELAYIIVATKRH